MQSKGYVYVASLKKAYYEAAKYSAESLLTFYPEAKITLFTHEEWVEEEDYDIFDQIITEDVPKDKRAKLWALSKTPYDITMYVDCDTYIQHEDIADVFDFIDEYDIIFTRNRPYNAKITKLSDNEEMIYHCGIFVYKNNTQTKKLMDDWYKYYWEQQKKSFDMEHYPDEARPWDTFTMWYLLNKTDHKNTVMVGDFPEPDARWNFCLGQRPEELQGQDVIITHYRLDRVFTSNEIIGKNKS